jgi:hypothetical protein
MTLEGLERKTLKKKEEGILQSSIPSSVVILVEFN